MCYTGGPYCNRVATNKVTKAKTTYADEPSYENFQAFKVAQEDYYGTSAGQKNLTQRILSTNDPHKKSELQIKKEKSLEKRAKEVKAAVSRQNMKEAHNRYNALVTSEEFKHVRTKLDNNYPMNVYDQNLYTQYKELHAEYEATRQDVIKTNQGIDRKKDVNENNDSPVYDSTGYDQHGYDKSGYNEEGYDKEGFDQWGYDQDKFDKDGYDQEGWDGFGYNRQGLHKDDYKED